MSSGILAACLRTTGLPLMGVIAAAIYYYDMTKNVVAFMQVYGWFVVLGCVGLFYLDHLFAIELAKWDRQQSLNAANGTVDAFDHILDLPCRCSTGTGADS
ncbi:hypothetical protein, variant 5 [Aphanomyces invadans]|uniref:Uncharacterized protein n=1 Tax=Aphanomyces invadans TaxID=157072 RepID=A0A024TE56_9STRA|nr:hypothetical protein, variant 4 [Aphanomyces invadans]XP_008879084.1 hypothetical protein, variant 5 [Aphanomyces invadans]ETV92333.1 hypothetical protein, variant 4 [Aphanomyces invadans]ETV92334.1 hypothetical protein, variant 5 [Aphanomyces invadans]|eukprot:XP_008879083.1 hypothetical protein, variant 4 [Aphanomyces invadans]